METIRKSITLSTKLADWYEVRAKSMGISQSAMMTVALDYYIKQEKAFDMMENMENVIKQLEELKKNDVLPPGE